MLRNERQKEVREAVRGGVGSVYLTNTLTPTCFLKYGCNLQLWLLKEIGRVNGLE